MLSVFVKSDPRRDAKSFKPPRMQRSFKWLKNKSKGERLCHIKGILFHLWRRKPWTSSKSDILHRMHRPAVLGQEQEHDFLKLSPLLFSIRRNYLFIVDKTILKLNMFKIQIFGSKQQEA